MIQVTPRPGAAEKDAFVTRLTRLIHGAMRDVERTHGDLDRYASSVAKRVATQLWAYTHPDQHPNLATWVQHLRGQLGMSQAELGERLQVNRVTVARWETGEREPGIEHQSALMNLVQRALMNLVQRQKPPAEAEGAGH